MTEARIKTFDEDYLLRQPERVDHMQFCFYNETPLELDGPLCKIVSWSTNYGPKQTTLTISYLPCP